MIREEIEQPHQDIEELYRLELLLEQSSNSWLYNEEFWPLVKNSSIAKDLAVKTYAKESERNRQTSKASNFLRYIQTIENPRSILEIEPENQTKWNTSSLTLEVLIEQDPEVFEIVYKNILRNNLENGSISPSENESFTTDHPLGLFNDHFDILPLFAKRHPERISAFLNELPSRIHGGIMTEMMIYMGKHNISDLDIFIENELKMLEEGSKEYYLPTSEEDIVRFINIAKATYSTLGIENKNVQDLYNEKFEQRKFRYLTEPSTRDQISSDYLQPWVHAYKYVDNTNRNVLRRKINSIYKTLGKEATERINLGIHHNADATRLPGSYPRINAQINTIEDIIEKYGDSEYLYYMIGDRDREIEIIKAKIEESYRLQSISTKDFNMPEFGLSLKEIFEFDPIFAASLEAELVSLGGDILPFLKDRMRYKFHSVIEPLLDDNYYITGEGKFNNEFSHLYYILDKNNKNLTSTQRWRLSVYKNTLFLADQNRDNLMSPESLIQFCFENSELDLDRVEAVVRYFTDELNSAENETEIRNNLLRINTIIDFAKILINQKIKEEDEEEKVKNFTLNDIVKEMVDSPERNDLQLLLDSSQIAGNAYLNFIVSDKPILFRTQRYPYLGEDKVFEPISSDLVDTATATDEDNKMSVKKLIEHYNSISRMQIYHNPFSIDDMLERQLTKLSTRTIYNLMRNIKIPFRHWIWSSLSASYKSSIVYYLNAVRDGFENDYDSLYDIISLVDARTDGDFKSLSGLVFWGQTGRSSKHLDKLAINSLVFQNAVKEARLSGVFRSSIDSVMLGQDEIATDSIDMEVQALNYWGKLHQHFNLDPEKDSDLIQGLLVNKDINPAQIIELSKLHIILGSDAFNFLLKSDQENKFSKQYRFRDIGLKDLRILNGLFQKFQDNKLDIRIPYAQLRFIVGRFVQSNEFQNYLTSTELYLNGTLKYGNYINEVQQLINEIQNRSSNLDFSGLFSSLPAYDKSINTARAWIDIPDYLDDNDDHINPHLSN